MNVDAVKRIKRSKPFTVLDIVITAVIIAAIGLSAWLIYRKPTASVSIVAGEYRQTLPVNKKADIVLEHLTVHIDGGSVWVTDSDCADGICEKTGRISRAGQSIVCLPHGVVITIVGEGAADGELDWEVG